MRFDKMDLDMAFGFAAAPGIVSGVLGTVDWIFGKYLPADAKRLAALALGVGYAFAANAAGVFEADNAAVSGLLGIFIGLSAMGWKASVVDRFRN